MNILDEQGFGGLVRKNLSSFDQFNHLLCTSPLDNKDFKPTIRWDQNHLSQDIWICSAKVIEVRTHFLKLDGRKYDV